MLQRRLARPDEHVGKRDLPGATGRSDGDQRIERDECRAGIHRGHAGDEIAAERAEIACLPGTDRMGGVLERREKCRAMQRRSHDLGMGGQRANAQAGLGDRDPPEVLGAGNIDQHLHAMRVVLVVGHQVGAAGQRLDGGSVGGEKLDRLLRALGPKQFEGLHFSLPVILLSLPDHAMNRLGNCPWRHLFGR